MATTTSGYKQLSIDYDLGSWRITLAVRVVVTMVTTFIVYSRLPQKLVGTILFERGQSSTATKQRRESTSQRSLVQ